MVAASVEGLRWLRVIGLTEEKEEEDNMEDLD